MSSETKKWIFRFLAADLGVVATAIAGVKADAVHFGLIYPIVIAAQMFLLAWLGKFIREHGAP